MIGEAVYLGLVFLAGCGFGFALAEIANRIHGRFRS